VLHHQPTWLYYIIFRVKSIGERNKFCLNIVEEAGIEIFMRSRAFFSVMVHYNFLSLIIFACFFAVFVLLVRAQDQSGKHKVLQIFIIWLCFLSFNLSVCVCVCFYFKVLSV